MSDETKKPAGTDEVLESLPEKQVSESDAQAVKGGAPLLTTQCAQGVHLKETTITV